jgi:hypothetical protein
MVEHLLKNPFQANPSSKAVSAAKAYHDLDDKRGEGLVHIVLPYWRWGPTRSSLWAPIRGLWLFTFTN